MGIHVAAFFCFLALSFGAHMLQHYCQKRRERKTGLPEPAKALHAHGVIAIIGSTVFHPTTLEAVKEFAVHIVVYSGMILPKH